MAFTRKFLSALGIEADKIDQIIDAHTEVTDALIKERDTYKADAEKLNEVQKQLDSANKRITESEDFKTQLDELRKSVSAKETADKKSDAFRKFLKEKGYSEKGIDKIAKYGGYIDGIELDRNGNIKDTEKLVSSVESEWGEYKPSETTSFTEPSTPPKNKGNSNYTKSEISKYAEAYYNRLYGTKKED